VGIRRAMKAGADFVLLLNNDVVVEPGFLEPLVALARKDESIGLVSGKMHLMGTDNLLWYAGAQISRIRGNVVVDGFRQADDGRFDQTREVGACTGAMMLIRRRVLETVGLLPEEYFFGQEEWDYSITVHKAGFRLYYCAESLVHHRADGSHGNTSPKIIYCGMRNRLIFQNKFLPQRVFKVWLAAYSFYVQHIAGKRLRLLGDDLRAYKLAHSAAVRDHRKHGRLYVDEEDLLNFEREFVLSKLA
jgi:GT2 family glycosyltransferase